MPGEEFDRYPTKEFDAYIVAAKRFVTAGAEEFNLYIKATKALVSRKQNILGSKVQARNRNESKAGLASPNSFLPDLATILSLLQFF